MHVHALHAKGEAKFWREPTIEVAQNLGLSTRIVRWEETKAKAEQ